LLVVNVIVGFWEEFPAGNSYRFRYLLDGGHWENDWAADACAPNPFGTEDSAVNV